MATIPSKNPIPSELPRDLKFNAGKTDEFVNSTDESFSDRFGRARMTIAGIEAQARSAYSNIGYIPVESFEDGATLTSRSQSLHYEADGNYYRWDGDLDKVVPAGSTPESSGGVGKGTWVNVTDNTLRSQLSSSSGEDFIGVFGGGKLSNALYYVTTEQLANSASFTDALQIAIKLNKKVVIPVGEFTLTKTIEIPAGHMIEGCGLGATKINVLDDVDAFYFSPGRGASISNVLISYTATNIDGDAITVPDGAMTVGVRNIFILGPHNGIVCGNNQGSKFENIDIWYYTYSGIYINDNFNDSFFSGIFLNGAAYNSSTIGPGVGIVASKKAHAMFFRDVEIIQSSSPMQLFGSSSTNILTCAFSFFENCFFDSSSGPVTISNSRAISFIGCWFSNRDSGVSVISSRDIIFQGCRFINCDSDGAIIEADCRDVKFMGCIFDSNGQANTSESYGIVSRPTTGLMISGCTFANIGTFSPTQDSGIHLIAGDYDRVSIHDNDFSATLASVGINNQGTVNNLSVKNNFGYRTQAKGQSILSSGGTTLPIAHGLSVTPAISDFMLTFTSGRAGVTDLRVISVDASNFTVSASPAPSENISFAWTVNAEDR